MDARIKAGMAGLGIATIATIGLNHLADRRLQSALEAPVETRRDRGTRQHEGSTLLERVARSPNHVLDPFVNIDSGFGQMTTLLLGTGAIVGAGVLAAKGTGLARLLAGGVLGAAVGAGVGLGASAFLARGRSIDVEIAADDLLAVGDADADGRVGMSYDRYDSGKTPDVLNHESRTLQRMRYDDPMDFAGTQSPSVTWKTTRLEPFDTGEDGGLGQAELRKMTASFDADGNGRLSHAEASKMTGDLGMETWRGTELTGLDKGSWKTSSYRTEQGYR